MKLRSFKTAANALALGLCLSAAPAHAHVDWTRPNQSDSNIIGLYSFDSTNTAVGLVQPNETCLTQCHGLLIGTPAGTGIQVSNSLVEPFFGPNSLRLDGAQILESASCLYPDGDRDATIEFWLNWDSPTGVSSLEIGFRSSSKLRLTRDFTTPANDRFGVQGTHGDFRSAPGFTNWVDIGTEEAPTGEWIHFAMTIHGTGSHYDATGAHDVYNAGAHAIFFLNGHPVGSAPFTVDLTGFKIHDATKLQIRNLSGSALIDEVTIWSTDLSQGGTILAPFSDGRGAGSCNSADPIWLNAE